jgi:hypothetical protein
VFVTTQEWFEEDEYDHIPSKAPGINRIGEGDERPEAFCQKKTDTSVLQWTTGRVPHHVRSTPVLHALYYGSPVADRLSEGMGEYMLEPGKTYEIVMQNYPACNGVCETHPWHMHGHKVWVVGTWHGEFNGTLPAEGTGGKPHLLDTFLQTGAGADHVPGVDRGCGYTVVRFVADNPGAWLFHCHVEFHQLMGMAALFYYPRESIPPPVHEEHHTICGEITPLVASAGRSLEAIEGSSFLLGADLGTAVAFMAIGAGFAFTVVAAAWGFYSCSRRHHMAPRTDCSSGFGCV